MRLRQSREYVLLKNAAKRVLPVHFSDPGPRDDSASSTVLRTEPVLMAWPEDVPKPVVGLVPDRDVYPYWTKFRRFLQANAIPFEIYDVHRADWRRRARGYDLVVWRPMGYPHELEECRRKVWFLEEILGIPCFPSSAEAALYDDKLLQGELLRQYGFPIVPTFISYSAEEALEYAATCKYPAVWKIGCGAGSFGVEFVGNRRQAERRIRQAFSFAGRRTYWSYAGQKDYVYLQPLMANAGYDLRVIAVGDRVLGYFRTPPRGEFRASGMRRWHYAALPPAAMRLARRVRDHFDLTMVGLDLLADPSETRLAIIEMSLFPQLTEDWDLVLDGRPGSYRFRGDEPEFVEERHATHDRLLEELLTKRWIAHNLPCSTGAGAA